MKISERFYGAPWAIQQATLTDIAFVVESRNAGVKWDKTDLHAFLDGQKREARPAQVRDGVAILPIMGVLSQRMNMLSEISGGTSTELIKRDLDMLLSDDTVKAIVLEIDSPGGGVHGVAELSQAIFEARGVKPIVAVASGTMASAAYWIGSAAGELVATPSSDVGSIGVFTVIENRAVAEHAQGLKTEIISAGEFKVAGNPHEPMSGAAREVIQEHIDSVYGMFVTDVARNRGVGMTTAQEMGDGRVHVAPVAKDLGFIDRIATVDQIVNELGGRAKASRGRSPLAASAESLVAIRAHEQEVLASVQNGPNISTTFTGTPVIVSPESVESENEETKDMAADITGSDRAVVTEQQKADIRSEERTRLAGFKEMVKALGYFDAVQSEAVLEKLAESNATGATDPVAKGIVLDSMAQTPTGLPSNERVDSGEAETDKLRTVIGDGIALRNLPLNQVAALEYSYSGRLEAHGMDRTNLPGGRVQVKYSPTRQVHSDSNRYRGLPLTEIGVELAQRAGWANARNVKNDDPVRFADILLGNPGVQAAGGGGSSFQTTGDFPGILVDAANKMLLAAYNEAPSSWRQWVEVTDNFADFKAKNVLRLGTAGDFEVIPEDQAFPQDKLGDQKSTYIPETRGKAWSFSREMLINDDLGAFNTLTVRAARAAERTINRSVYAILTGNPNTDYDSVSLFDTNASPTGHQNDRTSGAAPAVAELNAMQLLLRSQVDRTKTSSRLNVEMAFLIAPAAVEGVVLQLLSSTANPAVGGSAAGSSGVTNIWQNRVTPVIDAELDGNSALIYYGASRWQDASHIQLSFLRGEDTPRLEDTFDFDTKGRKFTAHQTWGVKAIEHVGIVRNAGA